MLQVNETRWLQSTFTLTMLWNKYHPLSLKLYDYFLMREFWWFKSQTLLDTIVECVVLFLLDASTSITQLTFFPFIFVGLKDEYEYFLRAIGFMLKRRTAVFMLFFCCH